jgi:sigma-E factor negative regulatory protein RseC
MDEIGKVVEVDGAGGTVTVAMKRTSACERCGVCITVLNNNEEMRIVAKNECAATVGDRVHVELQTESFLKAALILYGLPLVGFLTGCLLGNLTGNALAAFGCGVLLAGAVYAVIHKLEPRWKEKGYTPVATRVNE